MVGGWLGLECSEGSTNLPGAWRGWWLESWAQLTHGVVESLCSPGGLSICFHGSDFICGSTKAEAARLSEGSGLELAELHFCYLPLVKSSHRISQIQCGVDCSGCEYWRHGSRSPMCGACRHSWPEWPVWEMMVVYQMGAGGCDVR